MDATAESARKKGFSFLLSQDLFSLISAFLNPMDIIHVSQMNKQFHQQSTPVRKEIIPTFKRNLRHILRCCGYTELESVLEERKFVLSGSVVLQAILGEEWADSDIDLYSSFDGRTELSGKLADLCYRPLITTGDINNYIFDPSSSVPANFHGSKLSSLSEWGSSEPKTGVWKDGNKMLQMMVMKDFVPTAEEAIVDFDLDIVMNTWDGKTLHITAPTAVATKTANAADYIYQHVQGEKAEVLLQSFSLYSKQKQYALKKTFKRMHKYILRGFRIMVGTDEWTKEAMKLQDVVQM